MSGYGYGSGRAKSDFSEKISTANGYAILDFDGQEWEQLANAFHCHKELARCLSWMRYANFFNGIFHVESRGTHDYILSKSSWVNALKKAFPDAGLQVSPRRIFEGRFKDTDLKDKDKFAQNGLVIFINGREHDKVCPRTEMQAIQEKIANDSNWQPTEFAEVR